MTREPDLSWEALVEVTGANVGIERGALNAALKSIRDQSPDLDDADLAVLIKLRADQYRKGFDGAVLTPSALSKHWNRISTEAKTVKPIIAPKPDDPGWLMCGLCLNDGSLFVAGSQDTVPCPECNRGRKAEVAAYGAEGAFWVGREWARTDAPQVVSVS